MAVGGVGDGDEPFVLGAAGEVGPSGGDGDGGIGAGGYRGCSDHRVGMERDGERELAVGIALILEVSGRVGVDLDAVFIGDELEDTEVAVAAVGERLVIGEHLVDGAVTGEIGASGFTVDVAAED